MVRSVQITFDAHDPEALGRFWCEALGYVEAPPPDGFASWEEALVAWGVPPEQRDSAYAAVDPEGVGPRLYFQRVPEPKVAKNRVHLDVNMVPSGTPREVRAELARAEAERLLGVGATMLRQVEENGEFWVVLQDPEGNELCLQ